jgi:hypothetical protein
MGAIKRRHNSLYQQLVAEYIQNGYTAREAMEIAGDYLDYHERFHGLTNDEDFSTTICHIRDKEDDDDEDKEVE